MAPACAPGPRRSSIRDGRSRLRAALASAAVIGAAAIAPAGAVARSGGGESPGTRGAHYIREAQGLSKNWSGYLITGASFRHVSAQWRIPRVDCRRASRGYSAMWIGLGGYTGPGLEQVGTELDCPGAGRSVAFAWYELLPAPLHAISLRVGPGDRMAASVTVAGPWTTLQLRDLDRHRFFRRRFYTSEINLSSAEWVLEAPSLCVPFTVTCLIRPLLAFGRVEFTRAAVTTVDGFRGTIASSAWQRIPVVLVQESQVRGRLYALRASRPSSLRRGGSSFRVSYGEGTVRLNRFRPAPALGL